MTEPPTWGMGSLDLKHLTISTVQISHHGRLQATNMMSLNPSWGEMFAVSSQGLVQADSRHHWDF